MIKKFVYQLVNRSVSISANQTSTFFYLSFLQLLVTSGEDDLRTVVDNIIHSGFREHNPLIIEWIVRICNRHLRDVVTRLSVNHRELNSFVVQSLDDTPAPSSSGGLRTERMEDEESGSVEEEEDWSEAKESLEEDKAELKGMVEKLLQARR